MKLTEYQRNQLRAASKFGGEHIDKVAASLQRENPAAFWRESELHQRDFYHQPIGLHRSYVERFVPRRREQENERDQVMAQNHYLAYTNQLGAAA